MVNYGAATLVFELPAPPDRVWTALTDTDELREWFGETTLIPQTALPFSLVPHGDQLPAGTGEVVAVEPPGRLVLRWRADGRIMGLTIQLEPAGNGSVLRVAYSDTNGVEDGQPAALSYLYDGRLRAFLAGEPMPAVPAPPPPPPPVAPSVPVQAGPAESKPTAGTPPQSKAPESKTPQSKASHAAPDSDDPSDDPSDVAEDDPQARPRRRRPRMLPIAAAVSVAAVAAVVGFNLTGTPSSGTSNANRSASPSAPSSRAPLPSAALPSDANPSPSVSPAGPLLVATQITNRQPNSFTVVITITNRSTSAQTWRNVAVNLSSSAVTLSNVDGRVNYEWAGTRACFTPGPAVTTIPGSATVTFPFTVNGSVPGDVIATFLNHTECG